MRLTVIGVALLLACGPAVQSSVRTDPNLVTSQDLQDHAGSLCEILKRIRSEWFLGRRQVQSVFLEDVWQGGPRMLCGIAAGHVAAVRRIDATETSTRYGPRFRGPSLLVELRRTRN